jgi:hypothetical protein
VAATDIMRGMSGSRPWSLQDRTGGDLDFLLERICAVYPDVRVERLTGTHSADDDNVYWLRRGAVEVQIDTAPDGSPPFVIESDFPGSRVHTSDTEHAWRHAADELGRALS